MIVLFIFTNALGYAQDTPVPESERTGIKAIMEELDKLEQRIGERVEKKVFVKWFVLKGVDLFTPKDFEPILGKYRNKELGISELEKIAGELTAFYRSKGYITSLAYAPTQEISENCVEFRIIEGRIVKPVPGVKAALPPPEPRVLLKKFLLTGVNLFTPKDFEPILGKYRNKELGISELEKIAGELTTFYRSKGYITSLAYAPTQEISENCVEFRIIEGRIRDIKVGEARYYSREMIERKFLVEKGQILNYEKLAQSVRRINKQPGRTVKAVLLPGEERGTSDVLLKVDREEPPRHFYLEYNNRGTKYTTKKRFAAGFVDNNLLGYDDILSAKFQMGEDSAVYAGSADYNFPISRYDTRLGLYGAYSHADIGDQFKILSPEGKAAVLGIYLSHPLFDKGFSNSALLRLTGTATVGLDAVSVRNKILGRETSHDELRIVKAGISFDERDRAGRTLMSSELRVGIDDFLGSMEEDDVSASRLDAGSEFIKCVGSVHRITRLPFSSLLISSIKGQMTDNPLVNSEQFAFGGADSIRGFPENDYLADYGWMSTVELRTPAFIFPRLLKVPFDKGGTSLMDAIQFAYFIDYGEGYLEKPRVGEDKDRSLLGGGVGLRFELYKRLRGRVDWGFPLGSEEPSDSSSSTVHIGVQYKW